MLINDLSFAIRPFYDMIIARPLCLLEAFSRSVIKGQVVRRVGLAHHSDTATLQRCHNGSVGKICNFKGHNVAQM
jgi:hypothetical protein